VTGGSGLRRRAVRGAGVTVLSQGVTFAVQMVATVVLARLLAPADFGVVTMVTTFSVLLVSCGHVGFPDAVLQREDIDHRLASNLFWMNVGLGLLLTIGFAATGSLLAKFYGDARLGHIAAIISLTILFDSTSVLHLALLKRGMCFAAVSANEIVSRMASVAVSTCMGYAGFGYWSLVAGVVAYPVSLTIGAWSRCRWVPGGPGRVAGTGSVVRFAAHVFARYSIGYITQNTDNLLVGWRFGPGALGVYKKAYDLFVLPFALLTIYPVAVSTLSRLNRDRDQYTRYLLGGITVLALVGMGMGGILTLSGRDLVRLMLGEKWEEAGRIFTLFGPGVGVMLIYSTYGMIHLSIGTTGRFFRWGMVEFAVTVLLFFLTLRWGPRGVAAAWTVSYWVLLAPAFWYAGRPIQLRVSVVLGAVWRYILASALAGFTSALIIGAFPSLARASDPVNVVIRVVVTLIIFGCLYVAAVILLHRSSDPLRRLAGVLREMVPLAASERKSAGINMVGDADSAGALPSTSTHSVS